MWFRLSKIERESNIETNKNTRWTHLNEAKKWFSFIQIRKFNKTAKIKYHLDIRANIDIVANR